MKKINKLCVAFIITFIMLSGFACEKPTPSTSTFDYGELPYYKEDTMLVAYDAEEYSSAWIFRPFWMGNIIYNELVTLTKEGNIASGKLMYPAQKILSVRDYTLENEYIVDVDYKVDGQTITAIEGGAASVFQPEWFIGENIPSEYVKVDSFAQITNADTQYTFLTPEVLFTESGLVYKNYISVTYVYDPALCDRTLFDSTNSAFENLRTKLESGFDVSMVVYGDSIAEGCSASAHMNRKPFSPAFGTLVKNGLETQYDANVTLHNLAKGGMTSQWGAEDAATISALQAASPDLLLINFGINDAGSQLTAVQFKRNMRSILDKARAANNNCCILLYMPFPPNDKYIPDTRLLEYQKVLYELSEEYGAAVADMWAVGKELLKTRPYYGIAANNVNHPNDFMMRLYGMKALSAIIDWQNM